VTIVPRVSILIPTYNRPEHLRAGIAAALASTFEDIEVVVGDDGGSRGGAVCAAFDDPRLRHVANPRRLGLARNWNALLDGARGELLALCMDDDRLAPGFVRACVEAFDGGRGSPPLAVAFTNHSFVDEDGNEHVRRIPLRPGRHDDFAREFMLHNPVAVSAAMMSRAAWEAVRPLPDTAAADMVLFGRMAERRMAFHYVDAALMSYRTHPGQLSATAGFHDDAVVAWSELGFSDPIAERERLRALGDALVLRAAARLEEGRRGEARADLRAARTLARVSQRRLAPLHAATLAPTRAIGAAAAVRRRLRLRLRLR